MTLVTLARSGPARICDKRPAMPSRTVEVSRKMPVMELPVRTSAIALAGARVLLSPASTLTEEQLRALGPVDAIVAPNLLHTEGMAAAAAVFPEAELWGPPGVRERQPGLAWKGIFGADPWPFERELPARRVAGMPRVEELVFLDVADRALHVTDLAFNLTRADGLGARVMQGLFGTRGRFAVSRLFAMFVKDRAAFAASAEAILALDFDRLYPSHGAVVEAGAKEKLRAALTERGLLGAS